MSETKSHEALEKHFTDYDASVVRLLILISELEDRLADAITVSQLVRFAEAISNEAKNVTKARGEFMLAAVAKESLSEAGCHS